MREGHSERSITLRWIVTISNVEVEAEAGGYRTNWLQIGQPIKFEAEARETAYYESGNNKSGNRVARVCTDFTL